MDCFRTIIAKWVCSWTLSKRCGRVMITTQWLGCQLENSVSAHSSVIFDLRFWPLTGGKFFCSLQCVFLLERVLAVYVEPAQTLSLYNTRTHTHPHTHTRTHASRQIQTNTVSNVSPQAWVKEDSVQWLETRWPVTCAEAPPVPIVLFRFEPKKWKMMQSKRFHSAADPSFLPSFIPSLQVVQTVCGTLECVFIYIYIYNIRTADFTWCYASETYIYNYIYIMYIHIISWW